MSLSADGQVQIGIGIYLVIPIASFAMEPAIAARTEPVVRAGAGFRLTARPEGRQGPLSPSGACA